MPLSVPVTLGRPMRTLNAGDFVLTETSYAPAETLPRHFHDDAFLTFATKGRFEEAAGRRTFECGTFDVIVRPPGEMHSNRYGDHGAACVLVAVPATRAPFDAPALVPRSEIAARIAREIQTADAFSPLVVEGLLLELLGTAARRAASKLPPIIQAARQFIHAHEAEIPSLQEIARATGAHPSTVTRAFRAQLGCSPGEYVRRVRLETAGNALATSDASIAEIAVAAGFYDQSHFTNAFRRHTGMTPARYRRAVRRG